MYSVSFTLEHPFVAQYICCERQNSRLGAPKLSFYCPLKQNVWMMEREWEDWRLGPLCSKLNNLLMSLDFWSSGLMIPLLTLSLAWVATYTHTSLHPKLSRKKQRNKALAYLLDARASIRERKSTKKTFWHYFDAWCNASQLYLAGCADFEPEIDTIEH